MIRLGRRQALGAAGAAGAGLLLPGAVRAAGAAPIDTPMLLAGGRLWVTATIAGDVPRLFCIDTGAPRNFLRPEIARALKLPVKGGQIVGGLGRGRPASDVVAADALSIGAGVRVPLPLFVLYDFGQALPPAAAGLLAASLFTRRDSDLDLAAGRWRLWPDGRPDTTGMTPLVSRFLGGDGRGLWSDKIEVTAELAGRPYRLICDTGSPGGILLFGRAARANGLFDDTTPFAIEATAGFGGAAQRLSRVMRMGPLTLGPLRIERPLVTVMDPTAGGGLGSHDGLIGLALLQLLTVSTDVRRHILWVARNDRPPPPDRYRLAGLWLDPAADGTATVALVATGSPAAAAGLRAGDVVTDPPTYAAALAQLAQPPGRDVAFGVRRGGATVTIRYTLRPYL